MDKHELLETIRAAHQRLTELIDALSDEELAEPAMDGWTRKDLIAHIGWWQGHAADDLEAHLGGHEPSEPDAGDWSLDAQNAKVHAEWRDRPADEVRAFEREAYDRLIGLLERVSEDDLFDATRFRWTDGDTVAEAIRYDADRHYEEHLPDLRGDAA